MDILEQSLGTDLSHHAYCVTGEKNSCATRVSEWCEKHVGITTQGNPDFIRLDFDTFGIDDGRNIHILQMRKGIGARKVFLLSFNFITHEAQNALLKVLEEPTEGTHFFVITPAIDMLLPTVRSRLIHVEGSFAGGGEKQVKDFISAAMGVRMEIITTIVSRIKDDDESKQIAIVFLNTLERLWYEKKKDKNALAVILSAKQYVYDRSASTKTILEHIALTLPTV